MAARAAVHLGSWQPLFDSLNSTCTPKQQTWGLANSQSLHTSGKQGLNCRFPRAVLNSSDLIDGPRAATLPVLRIRSRDFLETGRWRWKGVRQKRVSPRAEAISGVNQMGTSFAHDDSSGKHRNSEPWWPQATRARAKKFEDSD